jgi:hypothetical protein
MLPRSAKYHDRLKNRDISLYLNRYIVIVVLEMSKWLKMFLLCTGIKIENYILP